MQFSKTVEDVIKRLGTEQGRFAKCQALWPWAGPAKKASWGLAILMHIPLRCFVQGAIPGQLWVACWPERAPLRGPLGLLKRVLLIEVAGTEVLGLRGVVTQSDASGPVGEVAGGRVMGLAPWGPFWQVNSHALE